MRRAESQLPQDKLRVIIENKNKGTIWFWPSRALRRIEKHNYTELAARSWAFTLFALHLLFQEILGQESVHEMGNGDTAKLVLCPACLGELPRRAFLTTGALVKRKGIFLPGLRWADPLGSNPLAHWEADPLGSPCPTDEQTHWVAIPRPTWQSTEKVPLPGGIRFCAGL